MDWSCECFLGTAVQKLVVNSKQLSAACEVEQDDIALQLLGNILAIHSTDAAVEVIITSGKVMRNIWRGSANSRAGFAGKELCAQRTEVTLQSHYKIRTRIKTLKFYLNLVCWLYCCPLPSLFLKIPLLILLKQQHH